VSSPQIIGATIGLIIGGIIFWLIRRDHMISRDGVRWLFIAAATMLYGAFPGVNDLLGQFLGISYPPIIPVLLGLGAILIKLLIGDIERMKTRIDIERVVQRMAMLEAQLHQLKAKEEQSSSDTTGDANQGRVKQSQNNVTAIKP